MSDQRSFRSPDGRTRCSPEQESTDDADDTDSGALKDIGIAICGICDICGPPCCWIDRPAARGQIGLWSYNHAVRCLTCQYDLRKLTSGGQHRCPECGREFDPTDSSTFQAELAQRSLIKRFFERFLFCAVVSFAITFACVWCFRVSEYGFGARVQPPAVVVSIVYWPIALLMFSVPYALLQILRRQR